MSQLLTKARITLAQWVKEQLSGGFLRDGISYNAKTADGQSGYDPLERFVVGALFPIEEGQGIDPATQDDWADDDVEIETDGVTPTVAKRYTPPSSTGFSFYVEEASWQLQLVAAAKTLLPKDDLVKVDGLWQQDGRFVGASSLEYEVTQLEGEMSAITTDKAGEWSLWNDKASIEVRELNYGTGRIITVTLINKQKLDADSKISQIDKIKATLFDVSLRCYVHQGTVKNYPTMDFSLLNDEEQEIALQYKDKVVYAIGHGAAVDSYQDKSGLFVIQTEFMPMVEVPQVTADVAKDSRTKVLSMQFLADIESNTEVVCQALYDFVDDYTKWIDEQETNLPLLDAVYHKPARRIIHKMRTTCSRMKNAIILLQANDEVACAFAVSNHAMHDQMQQANQLKGIHRECFWRPFQLAFFLTTLVSAIDDKDDFRDYVDLIWFATGGGKTEAYLGLTAFVIAYRRLVYPDSAGGLTAFMRYTLRLLTTQQFLRASRMICALELLRQQKTIEDFAGKSFLLLGDEPITIGLWVGGATSPNTIKQAQDSLNAGRLQNFVFTHCPWCDSVFDKHNFVIADNDFSIVCRHPTCRFYNHSLPCQVVDDIIYQRPPTLIVATLDKFARLTWEERANCFFGNSNRPPELIIQDELHLIAGSLGSVAGVYEAAIETVLQARGMKPKYIASTATIKEAKDQVQKLFARPLSVFPPQGLSADDAYFAKTVPLSQRAGRLYVGYFSPILKRQNNVIPLAATLFLAPFIVSDKFDGVDLDAWWTKIFYHGSLKGVGNTHNALDIGLRRFCDRLVQEKQAMMAYDNENMVFKASTPTRYDWRIKQLTSNATATELLQTFADLLKPQGDKACIDTVLATNMVAVGLDVTRLALMVINGQPLTTAEYIQASSRVGRGDIPGIVYINYYRDQARSLSHYENFYPYHRSFYRYVEPTSVTPFTYQSRKRALHAGLVLAIRHSTQFLANDQASLCHNESVDKKISETIQRVIDIYKQRCCLADSERGSQIAQHIDDLYQEWVRYAKRNWENRRAVYYNYTNNAAAEYLLCQYGDEGKGLWPTLNSMRNVENTAILNASLLAGH